MVECKIRNSFAHSTGNAQDIAVSDNAWPCSIAADSAEATCCISPDDTDRIRGYVAVHADTSIGGHGRECVSVHPYRCTGRKAIDVKFVPYTVLVISN